MQHYQPPHQFGYGAYFGGIPEHCFGALDQGVANAGTSLPFANMYSSGGSIVSYNQSPSFSGAHVSVGNTMPVAFASETYFDPQRVAINSLPQFGGAAQQNFAFNPNLQVPVAVSVGSNPVVNTLPTMQANVTNVAVFCNTPLQNAGSTEVSGATKSNKTKKRRSNENTDSHLRTTAAHRRIQSGNNSNTNFNNIVPLRPRLSCDIPLNNNEHSASPTKKEAHTSALISASLPNADGRNGNVQNALKPEWLGNVLTAKRIALLRSAQVRELLRVSQQRALLRKRAALLGEIAINKPNVFG